MTQLKKGYSKGAGSRKTSLKRNGLAVDCFFSENWRLQKKIERWCGKINEFVYHFDSKGHLVKVLCNGSLEEESQYNKASQRVEQQRRYRCTSDSTRSWLYYDPQGKLVKAGMANKNARRQIRHQPMRCLSFNLI